MATAATAEAEFVASARLSSVRDPAKLLRRIETGFSADPGFFSRLRRLPTPLPHACPIKVWDRSGANALIKSCGPRGMAGAQGADTESYDRFMDRYELMVREGGISPVGYSLARIRHYGVVKSEHLYYLVMERLAVGPTPNDDLGQLQGSFDGAMRELHGHLTLVSAESGIGAPQEEDILRLGIVKTGAGRGAGKWVVALPRDHE